MIDSAEYLRGLLGHGQVGPETLCLLAAAKSIGREFRFVVADGAVVAQGSYGRQPKATAAEEAACRALAEQVAAGSWQPDWVYMCDVGAVVAAVNRVAIEDHARRMTPESAI